MRSRTSVQTEDDQLIAGQSARVSGHSGLWFGAQQLSSQTGLKEFLISRYLESQRFMSQKSRLSPGVVSFLAVHILCNGNHHH